MEIILGGGGNEDDSKEVDARLKSIILKGKKRILYIPIALRGEISFEDCLKWFSKIFPLTEFNVEMKTSFQEITIDYLKKFDAIYIGGGNTYNLLEEIRDSGFDKLLKKIENICLYGGSAGAIILGEDISTSPDENKSQLPDYKGLGLIKNFCIWPHFTKSESNKVKKFILKTNFKVLAIPETSGIYIKNSAAEVLGKEEIIVFSKNYSRKYKPREFFKLN